MVTSVRGVRNVGGRPAVGEAVNVRLELFRAGEVINSIRSAAVDLECRGLPVRPGYALNAAYKYSGQQHFGDDWYKQTARPVPTALLPS